MAYVYIEVENILLTTGSGFTPSFWIEIWVDSEALRVSFGETKALALQRKGVVG